VEASYALTLKAACFIPAAGHGSRRGERPAATRLAPVSTAAFDFDPIRDIRKPEDRALGSLVLKLGPFLIFASGSARQGIAPGARLCCTVGHLEQSVSEPDSSSRCIPEAKNPKSGSRRLDLEGFWERSCPLRLPPEAPVALRPEAASNLYRLI
jgi:hypothetical protein